MSSVGHGGLDNQTGQMTIEGSTLSDNGAQTQGSNLTNAGGATVDITSTIVSAPRSPEVNCAICGGGTSHGFNLSSDSTYGFGESTDQEHMNPKLKPLADNGGPTKTMALKASSPAIDAGISSGLTTDQRGQPRPFNFPGIHEAPASDNSDIGAFERQS